MGLILPDGKYLSARKNGVITVQQNFIWKGQGVTPTKKGNYYLNLTHDVYISLNSFLNGKEPLKKDHVSFDVTLEELESVPIYTLWFNKYKEAHPGCQDYNV